MIFPYKLNPKSFFSKLFGHTSIADSAFFGSALAVFERRNAADDVFAGCLLYLKYERSIANLDFSSERHKRFNYCEASSMPFLFSRMDATMERVKRDMMTPRETKLGISRP